MSIEMYRAVRFLSLILNSLVTSLILQSNTQILIGGKQFFSSSQVEGNRGSAKSKKSNSHNNNSEHSAEVKLIQSQNLKLSSALPKSNRQAESHSNASEGVHKSKTQKIENDDKPLDLAEESEEDKEDPVIKAASDTVEDQAINRTEDTKTQEQDLVICQDEE